MDEFDLLNSDAPVANNVTAPSNEDDLFGSGFASNAPSVPPPVDTFNVDQQEDASWMMDSNPTTAPSQSNMFDDDTLADFSSASVAPSITNDFDSFESSAPSTTKNESSAQQTNSFVEERQSVESLPRPPPAENAYSGTLTQETVSPVQAFQARRQQEIAEKDVEEKLKIDEIRQQAKADLERWYKERQMQLERNRQTMKQDEDALRTSALEKSDRGSCDWSKIVCLLDFAPGTQMSKGKRDVTRMKSCLMQAKRDRETKKPANGV